MAGGISAEGIKGFDEVIKNLSREIKAMEGRTMEGLIDATIIIRRAMDTEEPKIPVDTNNLRGSYFTTQKYENGMPGIEFGFTANYALWAHEMVDADFKSPRWRTDPRTHKKKWYTPRAGAGAKFMESALNRHHDDILKAIADKVKIE